MWTRDGPLPFTINKLEDSLRDIQTLRGILSICCYCKKIRNDQDYWRQVEYFANRSEVKFSHGICPDCAGKLKAELS